MGILYEVNELSELLKIRSFLKQAAIVPNTGSGYTTVLYWEKMRT